MLIVLFFFWFLTQQKQKGIKRSTCFIKEVISGGAWKSTNEKRSHLRHHCSGSCKSSRGWSCRRGCQTASPTATTSVSKQRAQERRRGGNTELARRPDQEVCFYTFITTCKHMKLTFLSTENRKVSEWVAMERPPPPLSSPCATLKTHNAQDDGAAAAGKRNGERAGGRRRSAGRAPPSVSTTLRTNKRLRNFQVSSAQVLILIHISNT